MASCPSCRNPLDGSAVCAHCEAPDSAPQPDAPAEQPAGNAAQSEDVPPAPAAEPLAVEVAGPDGPPEDGPSETGGPEEPATAVMSAISDDSSDPATIQLGQVKPAADASAGPVEPGPEASPTKVSAVTPDDSAEAVPERAARREKLAAQLVPAAPVVGDPGESTHEEAEVEDPQRRSLRGAFIAAAAVIVLGAASAVALSSSGGSGSVPPPPAGASDSPSSADVPSDSPSAKAIHAAPSHSAANALHSSASPSHHMTPSPDPSQSIAPAVHSPVWSPVMPAGPTGPTSRPAPSSPGDQPTPKRSCSVVLSTTFCPSQ